MIIFLNKEIVELPQKMFLDSKREIRRLCEHQTGVWSLKFIQHLELGEDMVEECSYYGECFALVQRYQRRQEI